MRRRLFLRDTVKRRVRLSVDPWSVPAPREVPRRVARRLELLEALDERGLASLAFAPHDELVQARADDI